MHRRKIGFVTILSFCFIFLLVGLTQLRLDFPKSSFSTSDFIVLLPSTAWIYLICLPIGVLLVRRFAACHIAYYIPFIIVFVLLVVFPLVQFPAIFHWDSFTHATGAKYVADHGHLPGSTSYAAEYPGAFVISAIFSEIIGFPILKADLVLAAILTMLTSFLLLAIGQVCIGREKGWLVPMIYFAFSFKYFLNYHYSPHLVGLCLFVAVTYLVLKTVLLSSRFWKVLLILLFSALTVIHVFSAFFAIVMLIGIYVTRVKLLSILKSEHKQFQTGLFIMFWVVLFIGWHIFVSSEPFNVTIGFVSSILKGEERVGAPITFYNPLPGMLIPILQAYRYAIYGFIGALTVYCLVKFWRRPEVRLTCTVAFGLLFTALALQFTPATFGSERFLFYGGVIVSILASYAIKGNGNVSSTKRRLSYVMENAIPFLVICTFLVSNLYGSTYVYFIHPDEINAVSFAATKTDGSISAVIDHVGMIRYFASDKEIREIVAVDDRDPFEIAVRKFEQGEFSLQSLPRQTFYFNSSFIEGRENLVYSNGLCRVYRKILR